MAELLALFKSDAKFCFQSNSQGWFPDSVVVFPFVFRPLEISSEEISVLRWGGRLKVYQEIWQEGERMDNGKVGPEGCSFNKALIERLPNARPRLGTCRCSLSLDACLPGEHLLELHLPWRPFVGLPHRRRHPTTKLNSTVGCPFCPPHTPTCTSVYLCSPLCTAWDTHAVGWSLCHGWWVVRGREGYHSIL